MEELIKFRLYRHLISQEEFQSLLPEIISIVGKKDLISVSLLFHYFRQHLYDWDAFSQLEDVNSAISEIICGYQSLDNNQTVIASQMAAISRSSINNICSYLDIYSYHRFEQCNRVIFIAARSPYRPYTVPWCVMDNYMIQNSNQAFDKNKFIRLQSVDLKFSHRYRNCPDQTKLTFGQLRALSIHAFDLATLVKSFDSKNINVSHLNTLTIYDYTSGDNDSFNAVLQRIPNLEFLNMQCTEPPAILDESRNIFANLKGLSLVCTIPESLHTGNWYTASFTEVNTILDACSSKLIAFKTDLDLSQLSFDHVRFPNLRELILGDAANPCSAMENQAVVDRICTFDLTTFSCNSVAPSVIYSDVLGIKTLETVAFQFGIVDCSKLIDSIRNVLLLVKKKRFALYLRCVLPRDRRDGSLLWNKNLERATQDICNDMVALAMVLSYTITEDFVLVVDGFSEFQQLNLPTHNLDKARFCVTNTNCKIIIRNQDCKIPYGKRMHMICRDN
eukprot:133042_1